MKLAVEQHAIRLSDNLESQKFKIAQNAKMANILSDRLYSDKITAVIRELSTNAVDAHVEVGHIGLPIEVKLPDGVNNSFEIRDFGPSMDDDKVMTLYTTYGESDKDDSNQVTGCFGLGSKVPFCYHTRTFTVETWKGGIHRIYNCFRNEDNMPCISKTLEEPSDEPTGVKISLPVASENVHEFREKAEEVYSYFETTPKILRGRALIEKQKHQIKHTTWGFRKDYWSNECRAVMGNVAYDINLNDSSLTEAQRSILESNFDLFFNLGDLDIEASREGLSYDRRTILAVKLRLDHVISEICQMVENKVQGMNSLWEARVSFSQLFNDLPNKLFDAVDWSKIEWKGQQLFSLDMHRIDISELVKDGKLEVIQYEYRRSYRHNSNARPTKSVTRRFPCTGKEILCVNDLKRGALGRCALKCQEEEKTVILVLFNEEEHPDVKQEFLEVLGIPIEDFDKYFHKASSYDSPTSNRTGGKFSRKLTRVSQYVSRCGDTKNTYWKDTDKDLEEGGFYVEISRYDFVSHVGAHLHPLSLQNIISGLKKLGVEVDCIYGIRTADIKNLKKSGNWVELTAFARDHIDAIKPTINRNKIMKAKEAINNVQSLGGWKCTEPDVEFIREIGLKCEDGILLKSFADKYVEIETTAKQGVVIEYIERVASFTRSNVSWNSEDFEEVDLQSMKKDVYSKYPLVRYISDKAKEEAKVHLVNYVNSIDGE